MEVYCRAKFIPIAPRKARLLAGLIRGKNIVEARTQLTLSVKNAANPMLKALNSAVANATNNHGLTAEKLYVAIVKVDEGPKLKRSTPKAMGRATPIRLRTCHITLAVAEKQVAKAVAEKQVANSIQS
ncbi:MAG: 50S ribosomal protein L22 [Patescibacteria group bacterium]